MAAVAASYPLVTHQARKIYQECTGIKPKLFSGVGGYMARFMLLYGAVSTVLNFADSEGYVYTVISPIIRNFLISSVRLLSNNTVNPRFSLFTCVSLFSCLLSSLQ